MNRSQQQMIIYAAAALIGAALVVGVVKKKMSHETAAPAAVAQNAPTAGSRVIGTPPQANVAPYTGAAPASRDGYDPKLNSTIQSVFGQMRMLGASIGNAVQRKKITLDDLEKLHFGGVTGDIDPTYAIFNPEGRIKFKPLLGAWLDQASLDRITTVKGAQVYYSLRRQVDATGTTDTLFAVIPNPNEKFCLMSHLTVKAKAQLKFGADNKQAVADPAGTFYGEALQRPFCVVSATDNRLYWFQPLRARFLAPGGTMWQPK